MLEYQTVLVLYLPFFLHLLLLPVVSQLPTVPDFPLVFPADQSLPAPLPKPAELLPDPPVSVLPAVLHTFPVLPVIRNHRCESADGHVLQPYSTLIELLHLDCQSSLSQVLILSHHGKHRIHTLPVSQVLLHLYHTHFSETQLHPLYRDVP